MKEIGILTYHRAHNFGALLQAYALKKYLISLNQDVSIVDYFPDYHKEMYLLWPWSYFKAWSFKQKVKFILDFPSVYKLKNARRKIFESFIAEHIKPKPVNRDRPLDVLVYGSDQIWRYQDTPIYSGYNEVYFGSDLIPAKRRITYAASMGKFDKFDSHTDFFKDKLRNFDSVGIREYELLDKMRSFTDLPMHLTLDPIFLLSKNVWEEIILPRKNQQKYVLLYNLLGDKKLNDIAGKLAKEKGLEVVEITGSIRKGNIGPNVKMVVGPLDFLYYIFYANHIVTSSFHGVAFSILFQKSFLTYLPKNAGRVIDLLTSVGLRHLFVDGERVEDLSVLNIDYDKVGSLLEPMIERSKDYLKQSI